MEIVSQDGQVEESVAGFEKWKLGSKIKEEGTKKKKKNTLFFKKMCSKVRSEGIKKEARVGRKMNLLISTVRVPVVPRGLCL